MRVLREGAPFIPLELRRHIAQFCDRATLMQLALAQTLWAFECEPVLYARIGLCIGKTAKDNDATDACLRTLSTSSRKATMVRALLVWYTPYVIALQDDDMQAFINSEPVTRRVYKTIPYLHNLVDLRIRAAHDVKIMCDGLVEALAGENCRISLRTLHIPYSYKEHATQVKRILRAQSETLRLLALHDWFPLHRHFDWYTGLRILNKDCVICSIGGNADETDYDKLVFDSTEPARMLAVVRSLEMDPPLPPRTDAPNFNLDHVISIGLTADVIPDAARMSLLAKFFPHCVNLALTSTKNPAVLLDPPAIAASVAHFKHVTDCNTRLSRLSKTH